MNKQNDNNQAAKSSIALDTGDMTTTFARSVEDFDCWRSEDFTLGGVVTDAGNSILYKTGGWRSLRPVWDEEKCTNCMLCWVHCPDSSILVADKTMIGIDYDHCKGCGICALECRFEALRMLSESEAASLEGGQ
ncbi:MAG: 4Fe-4S binding protein [Coriobacteriales bacterium]|jgi:pyruvate ferredoxin oxidoreductase delta subunit|nr:4Fe-4S binding protein [Coriobacteriales bacterium]